MDFPNHQMTQLQGRIKELEDSDTPLEKELSDTLPDLGVKHCFPPAS